MSLLLNNTAAAIGSNTVELNSYTVMQSHHNTLSNGYTVTQLLSYTTAEWDSWGDSALCIGRPSKLGVCFSWQTAAFQKVTKGAVPPVEATCADVTQKWTAARNFLTMTPSTLQWSTSFFFFVNCAIKNN